MECYSLLGFCEPHGTYLECFNNPRLENVPKYQFSELRKYMHLVNMLNCVDSLTDLSLTTESVDFPGSHCGCPLQVSEGPIIYNRNCKWL